MKRIVLFLFMAMLLIVVACNNETDTENTNSNMTELTPLEVDLIIEPDKINPGEEVTFRAKVTQGEEAVEDADEVSFEIKEKGTEESEFLDGVHTSDGEYTVVKSFEVDGIYYVTAHVTARSMHTMPKVEIEIGNPDVSEESEADEVDESHEHHGSNHHHGNGQVTIDFPLEPEYSKGKQSTLLVSFEESEAPLTDARVRFEVWLEGNDKHEFLDANETDSGVYKAAHTFAEEGTYHVQVHIEKDEIHEHLEKTTKVK
ncbi:FixH family protein [Bacillus sinesaloumensis]|uniref:FixH family protein n=1 Tax=Litchfieldia sinesaloumensis TaxID=1926280 RepID=UPI0009882FD2|nr:FixH family protein [Bacillus sinesaloumensis]